MAILGIDTTSNICEVSLKIAEDNYKLINLDEGYVHSEKLLPTISQILADNNLDIADIKNIVVNIGPGSFTGIRVGVSCARAIAQLLNIKIFDIVSMDAVMFKAMCHFERRGLPRREKSVDYIMVLLDAMRNEAYSAIYDANGVLVSNYKISNESDVLEFFKANVEKDTKVLIAGSGIKNFEDIFVKYKDNVILNRDIADTGLGLDLIKFVVSRKGNNAKPYQEIKPFYIRKTAAEEKYG